jgi:hypothetical protein
VIPICAFFNFIDNESKVCKLKAFSNKSSRSQEDRNVFNNFEQASGALGLSMLSQQIADVNQDWYPSSLNKDTGTKQFFIIIFYK